MSIHLLLVHIYEVRMPCLKLWVNGTSPLSNRLRSSQTTFLFMKTRANTEAKHMHVLFFKSRWTWTSFFAHLDIHLKDIATLVYIFCIARRILWSYIIHIKRRKHCLNVGIWCSRQIPQAKELLEFIKGKKSRWALGHEFFVPLMTLASL